MSTFFFSFLLNHIWKCQKAWWQKQQKKSVSKPVTLKELKFSSLPYNKHLTNRVKSVCMGESWPLSWVQTERSEVCTHDRGQDSPIRPPARSIRANYCFPLISFSVSCNNWYTGTSRKCPCIMIWSSALCHISNTRDSVSSGYPNTEKRVENTTCSGSFLTTFEVFG